jgi:hypothetical protein
MNHLNHAWEQQTHTRYTFLLKGHEDLRQDERVMQLFGLVNELLDKYQNLAGADVDGGASVRARVRACMHASRWWRLWGDNMLLPLSLPMVMLPGAVDASCSHA